MLPPLYPADAIKPLKEELVQCGFQELATPEEVEKAVGQAGTTLVFVNAVCGCAGGTARPAVAFALQNKIIPDRIVTVFAGMERDAVERVRQFHKDVAAPSSPCMVLFKDGKIAKMIERSAIEGRYPQDLAQDLVAAFNEHCAKPGPSIPPEKFAQLSYAKSCGSSIPRAK
jgi:putative YphP/YqiW family bacilliredoxin